MCWLDMVREEAWQKAWKYLSDGGIPCEGRFGFLPFSYPKNLSDSAVRCKVITFVNVTFLRIETSELVNC
jgi:hypothetical protein